MSSPENSGFSPSVGRSASRSCPTFRRSPRPACPGTKRPTGGGSWPRPARPAPVIDRLNKEIKTLLDSEDVQKLFEKEGAEADYVAPAEFAPFIEKEIVKWGKVVKEANIKVK